MQVFDEVSRLRRVLVHEPGAEVDAMVPAMMEELLFDDILYGDRARDEHARFRRVLQLHGVEVLDAVDLLAETLAVPDARRSVFDDLLADVPGDLQEELLALTPQQLASRLVVGQRRPDGPGSGTGVDRLFTIPPLPNFCFQRDTQIVLGNHVVFAAMATSARRREASLSRTIFEHHPDYRDTTVLLDLARARSGLDDEPPQLEGGDVLVLSPEVLAVGLSERTNRSGIRALGEALQGREGPRWLVVVELPRRRAYMHLDTLLTVVDHGWCLAFPPVIGNASADPTPTYVLDLRASEQQFVESGPLLQTLSRLGVELEPIPCGGTDPLNQHREQWTDGANALAIAPGVITLFDRNLATMDELARRGFAVVDAEAILLGQVDPDLDRRVCIALRSHEISRARGGPHCLSHPLVRDRAR